MCEWVLVAQSCLTLYNPMECSPPGSSVHGILQARILEWVANLFSRESFPTQGSNPGPLHCGQILYHLSPSRDPHSRCCHHTWFLGHYTVERGSEAVWLQAHSTLHSPVSTSPDPTVPPCLLILLSFQSHPVGATTAAFSDSHPLTFRVFSSSNSWTECLASSFTFANHDIDAHPRLWFCTCFSHLHSSF